jgi:hypothetical protein
VSRIYFTELEVDEEMRAIARVRRDIKQMDLDSAGKLLRMTKCVSVTELEVEHDKAKKDEKLNEIAALLYEGGKNCNLHIDLASAKVCCTCS